MGDEVADALDISEPAIYRTDEGNYLLYRSKDQETWCLALSGGQSSLGSTGGEAGTNESLSMMLIGLFGPHSVNGNPPQPRQSSLERCVRIRRKEDQPSALAR